MPSRASLAPTDSDGRALVAQGYGADAFLDGPLQFAAKPQQEARLHHHEQRPDNQPGEVIDERRFAAFVIVTDELDHPAQHQHSQATAHPYQGALRGEHLRSEESRVGKEWVRTCRTRGLAYT